MSDIKSKYQDLRQEIAGMKVIDTHEHICSEQSRQQDPQSPYCMQAMPMRFPRAGRAC